nr:efflux RND transporter periplasmic adaptor subunit [uncultured Carboxylicivirga sp.]
MKILQYTIVSMAVLAALSSCGNQATSFDTDVAVNVSVEEVKFKPIEQTLVTTGSITPAMQIAISSEMAGNYLLQINPATGKKYKMGDKVKKGDLIIKLEDKEYENNANVEGAKLEMEISEMEYTKQKALYEKGGVTLRELVSSEQTLLTSKQTFENAEISLAKMEIRAPFTGTITNLPYFSPGVRIESGTEILGMMEYTTMVMDLSMPENLMGNVQMGQPVNIMNYALPNDTLKGQISELSPAIDVDARTFKGRINVTNEQGLLKPGMFVKAEIVVDHRDSALVIPKDVILTEGNRKLVYVAKKEVAEKIYIRTGIETLTEVEVIGKELKENDRLIVKGFETLRNRSKINIVKK